MLLENMLRKELLAWHTSFPSSNWKQVFLFLIFFSTRIKCFSSSKTFLILRRWDTRAWRAWPRTWRSCWCGTRSCCWPTWGLTPSGTSGPVSVPTGPSCPRGSWRQKYSELHVPANGRECTEMCFFPPFFSSTGAPVAVAERASGNAVCC